MSIFSATIKNILGGDWTLQRLCPLFINSVVLLIFMDRTTKKVSGLMILGLHLCILPLMASSRDLQHALEQFAMCEVIGMKGSTFMSEQVATPTAVVEVFQGLVHESRGAHKVLV